MKRAIAFIFAFLFVCIADASAQFDKTNGCDRYGFCSPNSAKVVPVGNACTTSSGTTITFTAQGVGGPNPNRTTVVTINWGDSTLAGTAELTAMTVGGISMVRAVRATGDNQNSNSEIWYVANPTGSSANIVATFSTAVNAVTIEVYSLIGFISAPIANTFGTTSVSLGYNNKQVALATASRRTNVSTSLSNMVNDFSSACGANLWGVHASQKLNGNGQTLTSTISPTSSTPEIALAIWAITPPSCTEGSAFLARTSGLDATHTSAYQTLICGLVADGIWAKLDLLYIFATQNTTTALLNLKSTSFNGTLNGSPTFTTDRGYTGTEGSITVYINTGFNPTSGSPQFTQNSAHISAWNITNSSSNSSGIGSIGAGGERSYILSSNAGVTQVLVNVAATVGQSYTLTTGHNIANRPNSTTLQGYGNGVQLLSNGAMNSTALVNQNFYGLAINNVGVALGTGLQFAQISIGSQLSSTEALNFYGRLRVYMTAVGVP